MGYLTSRRLALVAVSLAAGAATFLAAPYVVGPLLIDPIHWKAGAPRPEPPAVLGPVGDRSAAPAPSAVGAMLAPLISGSGLGGQTAVSVVDVASGQPLYAAAAEGTFVPASTTKILTALTVLAARGPGYRLRTTAVAGATPGEVVLVGGGDSTLAPGADGAYPGAARLDELAKQARAALSGTAPTRVVYDSALFGGDGYAPGWDSTTAADGYAAPIRALTIDGARTVPHADPHAAHQPPRHEQPEVAAAKAFAAALGVPATAVAPGRAPAGARELGAVESPPLSRLVEMMLLDSDNVLAEALARQVAVAKGQPATFAGAAAAMKSTLAELGVPTAGFGLADGSGLSRNGRLSAALLTAALAVAARPERPELHAAFAGLPVAGYSGTLSGRYRKVNAGGAAAGSVRAKTGTLAGDGVHALAGIVIDAEGRVLAFAVLANSVTKSEAAAREAIDRIVAGLAGCGCR